MRNITRQSVLLLAVLAVAFSGRALAQDTNRPARQRVERRKYPIITPDKSRKTIFERVWTIQIQNDATRLVPFRLANVDARGLTITQQNTTFNYSDGKVIVTALIENQGSSKTPSAFLVAQVVWLKTKTNTPMKGSLADWDFVEEEVKGANGVAVPQLTPGQAVTLQVDLTNEWWKAWPWGSFLPSGINQGVECVLLTSLPKY